ncbi:molybdopterin-binding protein [Shimia biformata]|uniref:molybdopterin-binding protein n=1 Tax=Shimia biformata TaxID=1294299 RepID=UPI00194E4401|nr:molybdopterin-binding protein [Shimia biformata]
MKFGPVSVSKARGAILAHSIKPEGGRRIAKGTVLGDGELAALMSAGVATVVVARPDPGDVTEDAAALELARAIVPEPHVQGLRISGAGTGRVNLYATGPGVVRVATDKVAAINGGDPMITIATVPPFHRVDAGGMVATIKIISYAVGGAALRDACASAVGALAVAAPVLKTATLIETVIGSDTPSDKGRASMAGRLDRLGVSLAPRLLVPHDTAAIAAAIEAATSDLVLILTGSATSDAHDVAPEALRQAGGAVARFGMPVDPGNLLFLGNRGATPVIGLPGCARSPALNGADWVLERVVCGIPVSAGDIAAMGVGGLLKEIPTRPMPRRAIEGDGN